MWRHSADAAVSAAADNEGTPKPEYIIQSLAFILCSSEMCFRIGSLLFHWPRITSAWLCTLEYISMLTCYVAKHDRSVATPMIRL